MTRAYQLAVLCAALNGVLPRSTEMGDTDIVKEISPSECQSMKVSTGLMIDRAGRKRQVDLMQILMRIEKLWTKAAAAAEPKSVAQKS